jgi:regulator of replication initiation timing
MKKKLPLFEFIIDDSEESGVKAVSIVDDPAFKSSLIAFENPKPKFVQFADKKGKKRKQICAGLSLIPNVLIYRVDELFGEYYGYFSAETIEKIVEKYHEEMNTNKVNLGHDNSKYIDAFLVSDYIVDSEEKVQDLKRMGIEHENIMGSWFTAFKIKDPNVFDEILKGDSQMGFSVEAILDTFLVQMSLGITKNNMKKEMKKNYKSLMDKIIDIFRKEELERALVPEFGFEIEWTEVGQPVQQVNVDVEGNETLTPLGPGEFKTDTGIIVVDDSSNLVEVRDLPIEEEPEVEVEMPDLMLPAEDMPTDTSTGDTTNTEMKDYPWDQCIADRQAEGYGEEAANKICGYIRSKNMKSEELTKEMIDEILKDDCPDCNKKQFSEVEFKELETKFDEQTATLSELKVKFEEVQKENEALKIENNELKEKMKEPINEPILDATIDKKDWAKMSAFEKALYKSRQ